MNTVVKILGNPSNAVADELQKVVDAIRKGECDAKSGVLTLSTKNDTITTTTLGTARTSEYMGMLAYSSARLYELIDP